MSGRYQAICLEAHFLSVAHVQLRAITGRLDKISACEESLPFLSFVPTISTTAIHPCHQQNQLLWRLERVDSDDTQLNIFLQNGSETATLIRSRIPFAMGINLTQILPCMRLY